MPIIAFRYQLLGFFIIGLYTYYCLGRITPVYVMCFVVVLNVNIFLYIIKKKRTNDEKDRRI